LNFTIPKRENSLQVLVPAGKPERLRPGRLPPYHVPGRFVEADEVHGLMDIEEPESCGLFTGWRKQGDLDCGRPLDRLTVVMQNYLTIFIDMIITG